eukprot:CAMPEP_0175083280 /NCGR_PEP_ID=MMETSP0052_2-20121109/27283_1 /TAXON_ID=51329 ORGANISM="Polytomella parva, Strain SAG 63-3" /NCGR_SAMPLE_ID=MMETSP0052_2 /ASSEMBLY_ACC=CAM_ASM_000194 /LENGTH=165 /DNA_ID=CAMNT_0016354689 /DNA_START=34 /DNA_END=527 /DNA_ORIENTATION=-
MITIENHLYELVQENLSLFLYQNAVFFCEQLVAYCNSERNLQLLATSYFHDNQLQRAIQLLKDSTSPKSRYLLAVCFRRLGEFHDAEVALRSNDVEDMPMGAAGLYLLADSIKQQGRKQEALKLFEKAVEASPLMWSAFMEVAEDKSRSSVVIANLREAAERASA